MSETEERPVSLEEITQQFEWEYAGGNDPWDYSQSAAELLRYQFVFDIGKRQLPKPNHILEIGCGMGFFTEYLLGWAANITGIDISPTAIAKAQERFATSDKKGSKVEFIVGSAADAPLPEQSLELVTLLDVLESVANSPHIQQSIIATVKRLLKPGGMVLFTDYAHPSRFPELLQRYKDWGFTIVEHHYLNDRLWHSMRANFKGVRNIFPFKQLLSSLTVGRFMARISARRGPNGSKHMLVVARYHA